MSEPVTIGDQTFIKTADGWIDKKSKAPADKGLMKLLNSLSTGEATKKLRVRIDRSIEPVSIAGTKYVFDSNQQAWIDEKTRMVAPESLQKTLNSAVGIKKATEAPTINQAMGEVGAAAQTRVRTPTAPKTGGGNIPVQVNKKINTPIVSMIEKLATIDGYLKQRLENQKTISNRNIALLREQAIESKDAEPVDIQPEQTTESNNSAAAIVAAVGLAAIIAAQFDPVKETIGEMVDFTKKMFSTFSGFFTSLNDSLKNVLGNSAAVPAGTVTRDQQGNITAAAGYKISQPNDKGERYVYKEGSEEGYKINENDGGAPTINYSDKAKISPTGVATPQAPAAAPVPSDSSTAVPVVPSSGSSSSSSSGSSGSSAQQVGAPPVSSQPPVTTPPVAAPVGTPPSSTGIKPSDVLNFTGQSGSEANFNALAPETKDALLKSAQQYKAETGQKLTLNSGKRSSDDQNRLWNMSVQQGTPGTIRWPSGRVTPVASPGTSPHERGYAVDIAQGTDPRVQAIMRSNGLIWYGAGDNVHFTLQGHGGTDGGIGGGGGDGGLLQSAGELISEGMKTVGSIVKGIGKEIVGARDFIPMSQQTRDAAKAIQDAQIMKSTAVAEIKSPPVASSPAPTLPNLNAGKQNAPVRNPPTQADRSGTLHYLQRQGLSVA